ncbi:malonyl-CoA decarboxylase [Sphingobium nicotianae]|uniref:Malonyl-CoA decarboxylase family protein n=1 Tax=Sphingobium nicotianae TaxID=2782607 RepID=A0A9X1AJN2_9SPHN|nr:malonyl-CoA decarboxylase [Sphingobium nicotianae]MBT2185408.1 malonyl-CoA decarboxylase family protein [Sphingobium nicotianae]
MLKTWTSDLYDRIAALASFGADKLPEPIEALCDRLLAPASPNARLRAAGEIHARFAAAGDAGKRAFLSLLADRYTADPARLDLAILAYQADRSAERLADLHAASEPRRQQILRRLNEVPDGTTLLLAMRGALLGMARDDPGLAALDGDFSRLFSSWFNGGFLVLRQLDWSTSGAVLTKLMHYEAVHPIESWEALRARLEPADRRCYGLFHPMMDAEPLIFVEVALTRGIPISIAHILRADRVALDPDKADTAVFYSISNCQDALRGVPFGGPLIKQVMDRLRRELPGLRRAVTLSPMPGFARWLRGRADQDPADLALVGQLAEPDWHLDPASEARIKAPLMRAAARYLTMASGRDADPVARFHLGNGARIEQLDWLGDVSPKGLRQSHGMMVNYLYDPAHIDDNHFAFAESGAIAASGRLRRQAREEPSSRLPWLSGR